MTTPDPQIVLTDDEVVALAIAAKRPWPTAVPSLEPSARGLAEAAFRGSRSLALRGEAVPVHLLDAWIRPLLDSQARATLSIGRSAGEEHGSNTVFHQIGDRIVREAISIDGLHTFRAATTSASTEEIIAVLSDPEPVDVAVSTSTIDGDHTVAAAEIAGVTDPSERRRAVLARMPLLAQWSLSP